MLPPLLRTVRQSWPAWRIALIEDHTDVLVAGCAAGSIDLLLLALEAELGNLETRALYRDPFALLVPTRHRLAGRRRLRAEDLDGETMLLLQDGHCLRDQALDICASHGATESVDVRGGSLPTLIQMVAGGMGSTLVPAMSLATEIADDLDVSVVPLPPPKPYRTIGLAWRSGGVLEAERDALAARLAVRR